MKLVTLGPVTASSLDDLRSFDMDDGVEIVTFSQGDRVTITHEPTDSRAHGIVGDFFGVGRVRGVNILNTAFGNRSFVFGQPQDETNGWHIAHHESQNNKEKT